MRTGWMWLRLAVVMALAMGAASASAVAQTFSPGQLLISELRFAGPLGVHDGYVELYNTGIQTVEVGGVKLTYALAGGSQSTVTLPSGATILPYGHYLVADSAYSLSTEAAADTSIALAGAPVGVKLTNSSGSKVIDAVGETGAPAGFYSGTPLTAPSATGQIAFVRHYSSSGTPVNSRNNQSDFALVATDANTANYGESAEQGAPDPRDTSSLIQANRFLKTELLNASYPANEDPNEEYDAKTQTLTLGRQILNTSGVAQEAQLVFTSIPTFGSPGAGSSQAVLLAQNDPCCASYSAPGQSTPASADSLTDAAVANLVPLNGGQPPPCNTCLTPVYESSLNAPSPAGEGGLNSSLTLPQSCTKKGACTQVYIPAGKSLYVNLQFHEVQSGSGDPAWNLMSSPQPTVAVSPSSGHTHLPGFGPGATPLTVTGGDWPAGDSIAVLIGGDLVCYLTADSLGNINSTASDLCQAPNLPAGSQPLTAVDDSNSPLTATGTPFTDVPALNTDPLDGSAQPPNISAGNPVYVTTADFAANSPLSFKINGTSVTSSPSSPTTDANGALGYGHTVTVPAGTTAGSHTITATDGAGDNATSKITVYRTSISVTPTQGHPIPPYAPGFGVGYGTSLAVSGSGWPANDPVEVRVGGDLSCLLTTDASGNLSATAASGTCQLPGLPAGPEPVTALDDNEPGLSATNATPFAVSPVLHTGAGNPGGNPDVSPGNQVFLTGAGYAASSALSFTIAGIATGLDGGTQSTNGAGTFNTNATITVPTSVTAGSQTVVGTDAAGNGATASITVYRPTVSIAPSSGAAGAPLTVSGSGWPADDPIPVYIGSTQTGSDEVCQLTADGSGNISATAAGKSCQVPGGESGSQPVNAYDNNEGEVTASGGSFTITH